MELVDPVDHHPPKPLLHWRWRYHFSDPWSIHFLKEEEVVVSLLRRVVEVVNLSLKPALVELKLCPYSGNKFLEHVRTY
ncbi:hypothetical protein KY285_010568 [Solanum tuberosum]|nr:hypothetical protein KY289_011113 [Solanum tuberosum]KAH0734861.1 hypothetical protein KY285_010568 [Solanum tuberosum]